MMFRAAAFALSCLVATPLVALDLENMNPAERDAFRAEIRAYLMENPEIIMEAVQVLEQRQAELQARAESSLVATNREALFEDGFSWVGGNPDGDVTLVEFMDYRCGYCRKASPEVAQLLESDGKIRLIVKEFPILGEASLTSARFAIAARRVAGDEAYEQIHDALIELSADPTEVVLARLAEGFGLDVDAIMAEMESEAVSDEIAANHELARILQINGTPTFVLEDRVLRGYVPLAQMQDLVEEIRTTP